MMVAGVSSSPSLSSLYVTDPHLPKDNLLFVELWMFLVAAGHFGGS